jgi:hypothetical protein
MIINEIVVDTVVRFRLVLASKYTISFKDTNSAYFIKTFNAAIISLVEQVTLSLIRESGAPYTSRLYS